MRKICLFPFITLVLAISVQAQEEETPPTPGSLSDKVRPLGEPPSAQNKSASENALPADGESPRRRVRKLENLRPIEVRQLPGVNPGLKDLPPSELGERMKKQQEFEKQFQETELQRTAIQQARKREAEQQLLIYALGFILIALITISSCDSPLKRLLAFLFYAGVGAMLLFFLF